MIFNANTIREKADKQLEKKIKKEIRDLEFEIKRESKKGQYQYNISYYEDEFKMPEIQLIANRFAEKGFLTKIKKQNMEGYCVKSLYSYTLTISWRGEEKNVQ